MHTHMQQSQPQHIQKFSQYFELTTDRAGYELTYEKSLKLNFVTLKD